MAKFISFILISAILIFFTIFALYNHFDSKRSANYISREENNIYFRAGNLNERFRLYSDPSSQCSSQISWDCDEAITGSRRPKIIFNNSGKRCYLGLYSPLTLNFEPYLKKGILELNIKTRENTSVLDGLKIFLKERFVVHKSDDIILLPVNSGGHKMIVEINKFFPVKNLDRDSESKNIKPTWEVHGIFLSLDPSALNGTVELIIDSLRVVNEGEIIYDLL